MTVDSTALKNSPPAISDSEQAAIVEDLFAKTERSEKSAGKVPTKQKPKFLPKRWHKIVFGVGIFLTLLLSIAGVIGFYTYQQVQVLQAQAKEAEVIAQAAYGAFKGQNLPESEVQFKNLQQKVQDIKATYQKLSFYNSIPFANRYYQDGQHGLSAADHGVNGGLLAISAITPYADVLGFQGEDSFTGGTAEDRIKLMIETLDKVMPSFDQISAELQQADQELAQIDPNRYPEEIKGIALRNKLTEAQAMSHSVVSGLTEFRPVIEQLPDIAGGKGERKKYLILFQNDNELRPTGGFLTAYSVIFIENGKVTPEKSDDIYELDKKYRNKTAIPAELGRYLTTERYFNLRDMNISPDFKISMDQFLKEYKTVRGEPTDLDGIIAVDTQVLTDLLKILGPVEVPGYGTFSAENDKRCDCPQVVYALSEIITKPTPYLRADRKGILGPMMQAILLKTYGAPKEKWPGLFELAWKDIEERHVQMYFMDEKAQQAAEAINAAGRLPELDGSSDFLAIVNANLGGAKSNLFTSYEVKQEVSAPENGQITKTVEITYKNSRKADNCNLEAGQLCLNSTLNDWTRLYLPPGSKLVDAQGFTMEPKEYEENGFAVIDGFFSLEPLGVAKVRITYTVPYTDTETYRVQLWKQGGIDPIPTLIDVNGGEEQLVVNKDQLFEMAF